MNSNKISEALGKVKEKTIEQHKSVDSNLNIRQKIRRIEPTKKLKEKILSKKNSITSEKLNKDNSQNKLLEYQKLSYKRNEFSSILKINLSNLTYQENPKLESNYNSINNFNKKKISNIFKAKTPLNEKLNLVILTDRNEKNENQNKNRLNATPLPKKRFIKIKKNPKEVIKNITSKKIKNELERENSNLKEEINKLKKELIEKDKIIQKQNTIIKRMKYIINNNKKQNKDLLDEIKKIKSIIPFDILPGENIMSIIFKSDDENIISSVLCKSTDKFIRLKNIIYNKYPEYKEYENYFLFNEKKINENETLEENKIKDGSIITIYSNYD